jgi:zinc transporter
MDSAVVSELPRSADQTVDVDLSRPPGLGGDSPVPGLVWAFRIRNDGTAEALPIDQPIEDRHDGWVWLHLNLVDTQSCRWLKGLNLPLPATSLLASHDSHQQLHAVDGCIYGVFSDLSRELGDVGNEFAHLHFLMTERILISGRYRPLAAVEKVREAVEQGQLRLPSAAALLEMIVEHVADVVDRMADKLSTDLDTIEDHLSAGSQNDHRKELGRSRRTSVKLHRQLSGLRTLFHRLERDGLDGLKQPLRLAAGKLAQRLDALDHDIVEIRDRSRLLQEEVSAAIASQSDRSLTILTVITTVILPPTLVTGIFGMNVKGLPFNEDPSGFLWTAVLMAASSLAVFWVMKKIGALKF